MQDENNKQSTDVSVQMQGPALEQQPSAPQAGTDASAQEPVAQGKQTPENTLLGGSSQKPTDIPQKTDDGNQPGDGKNEVDGPEPDYSFKLPEGFSFAEGQQDAYTSLSRELKLTPDAAQKVLDYGAGQIQAALKRQEEGGHAVFDEEVVKWGEETKKRLGPDEAVLHKNLAEAKTAIDAFATDGFKKLLDSRALGGFGLGNHPEVVETFLNIAKAIKPDMYVARRKSGGAVAQSEEEIFYPNQVPGK